MPWPVMSQGGSGHEVMNWITFLVGRNSFPKHINFYFPTAPSRPYTPAYGELSTVWFDRYSITPCVPEHMETLEDAGKEINKLIHEIVKNDGVSPNRIVIGGFSMGGALALHVAYRFNPGLAGVFTLSSFLNNDSAIFKEQKIPEISLYMCHGDRDSLVPIDWGRKTYEDLTKLGVKAEFVTIKNTLHELKKNEILGLFDWIQKILPSV
nr:lysophospholipase-like protein 1 isoform X2 [Leptinotarsa decemlineata]